MIILYVQEGEKLTKQIFSPEIGIPNKVVWIDLLDMTPVEKKAVEDFLEIDIPSREEMHEIEMSSRLYQKYNAFFMTITLVSRSDTPTPESHAVTFILIKNRLITLRYVDLQSFLLFSVRTEKMPPLKFEGVEIFVGLLESIIDRTADIIEHIDLNLDMLTSVIFTPPVTKSPKRNLEKILETVGYTGDLISRTRESLVTIIRMANYAIQSVPLLQKENLLQRFHLIEKDAHALSDHIGFLGSKVNFLLDATLGMINIEQNNIIKIFSIAAVVLLPPTLVGTIYGMNFRIMPELHWAFGYPMALGLMVIAAVLPYLYFKKKKWL